MKRPNRLELNLYFQQQCNGTLFGDAFINALRPRSRHRYSVDLSRCLFRFDALRELVVFGDAVRMSLEQNISALNGAASQKARRDLDSHFARIPDIADGDQLRDRLVFWQKELFCGLVSEHDAMTTDIASSILSSLQVPASGHQIDGIRGAILRAKCSDAQVGSIVMAAFDDEESRELILRFESELNVEARSLKELVLSPSNDGVALIEIFSESDYLRRFKLAQCWFSKIGLGAKADVAVICEVLSDAQIEVTNSVNEGRDEEGDSKRTESESEETPTEALVLSLDPQDPAHLFLFTYFAKEFEEREWSQLFAVKNAEDLQLTSKLFLGKMVSDSDPLDLSRFFFESKAYREDTDFLKKQLFWSSLHDSASFGNSAQTVDADDLSESLRACGIELSEEEETALFVGLRTESGQFDDAFFDFYDSKCNELGFEVPATAVIDDVLSEKNERRIMEEVVMEHVDESRQRMERFDFYHKMQFVAAMTRSQSVSFSDLTKVFASNARTGWNGQSAHEVFEWMLYLKLQSIDPRSAQFEQRFVDVLSEDSEQRLIVEPLDNALLRVRNLLFSPHRATAKMEDILRNSFLRAHCFAARIFKDCFSRIEDEKCSKPRLWTTMCLAERHLFALEIGSEPIWTLRDFQRGLERLVSSDDVGECASVFLMERMSESGANADFMESLFDLFHPETGALDVASYRLSSAVFLKRFREIEALNPQCTLTDIWTRVQEEAVLFLSAFDTETKKRFCVEMFANRLHSDSVTVQSFCDILSGLDIKVGDGVRLAATRDHVFFFSFIKLLFLGGSKMKNGRNTAILHRVAAEMVSVDEEGGDASNQTMAECELDVDLINELLFEPSREREKETLEAIVRRLYDEAQRVMDDLDFRDILEMQRQKVQEPDQGLDDEEDADRGLEMEQKAEDEEREQVVEEEVVAEEESAKQPDDGQEEVGRSLEEEDASKRAEDTERVEFDGKKEDEKGTAELAAMEGFESRDDGKKQEDRDPEDADIEELPQIDDKAEGLDLDKKPSKTENPRDRTKHKEAAPEENEEAKEPEQDLDGRGQEEEEMDAEKEENPSEGVCVEEEAMDEEARDADIESDGPDDAKDDGRGVLFDLQQGADDGMAEVKGVNAVEIGGKQNDIFEGIQFQETTKRLRSKRKRANDTLEDVEAEDEFEDDDNILYLKAKHFYSVM